VAPGVEFGDLNWLAIGIAMVSNIVLGFLWYSPKMPTGKVWMKGMGFPADMKPTPKQMVISMALMIIGTFLLMFILQHSFIAYRDAYRFDDARLDSAGLTIADGLTGGFFTWLGFFLPVQLGLVAWEGKSWGFMAVVTGYYLVSLVIAGLIFAAFV
jgi:hypothetical protein